MIKAVIFDMDGLMVDTERMCCKAYQNYFLKHHSINISEKDYGELFAGRTMPTGLQNAFDYYNVEDTLDHAIEIIKIDEFKKLEQQSVPLKKGLIELLEYLTTHQYKIAMATSSNLERVHQLLDEYDILKHFNQLISGTMVKRGKPYPDVFLKACEVLDVLPEEALVLEDADSGIQAAYDGNIKVICIPDMRYPKYPDQCTAILESLDLVIDYLKNRA